MKGRTFMNTSVIHPGILFSCLSFTIYPQFPSLTIRAVYDKLEDCQISNLLKTFCMIVPNDFSTQDLRQSLWDNHSLPTETSSKRKSRLIVQKGREYVPLFLKDVALIYTESKLTYVLTRDGRKYISEMNLGELANLLDKEKFFRANRQYILNMEYIRSYRPYGRSKLQVEVNLLDIKYSIIISQENSPHFRSWISEA